MSISKCLLDLQVFNVLFSVAGFRPLWERHKIRLWRYVPKLLENKPSMHPNKGNAPLKHVMRTYKHIVIS